MNRKARVVTTALLIVIMSAYGAAAQAQTSADVWKGFAERVGVGTELTVRLNDGRRLHATLVGVRDDAVLLQPRTRITVPVQTIPYDTIVRMEPRKPGQNLGKAVAIGVATGVGVFFGIMAILVAAIGD